MMSYEFVLNSPVLKEFSVTTYIEESIPVESVDEETGETVVNGEIRRTPVTEHSDLPADRVRLCSMRNDKDAERLFVRFIYGHLSSEGEWRPALLDDGLVVSGPDYHKVDLDLDGVIEENEVLAMCAKLLKWEGDLVEVPTPSEGEQA